MVVVLVDVVVVLLVDVVDVVVVVVLVDDVVDVAVLITVLPSIAKMVFVVYRKLCLNTLTCIIV